jgi:phosphoribosylamine--glycine ligase
MAKAGTPYSGVLYAGLMLTRTGPKLIEYNARFGDPECQVLMMRLEDDLLDLMLATEAATLAGRAAPRFQRTDTALTVVMAAKGYPGTPETGGAIGDCRSRSDRREGVPGGHEAARRCARRSGGRVLTVTATGASVTEAQAAAYRAVDAIDFPTGFARRDIGWREVAREAAQKTG